MTVTFPTEPLPTAASRTRSLLRGVGRFFRRAPLSAFWGCIAALIVAMAIAAPAIAPYEPLKSDFRSMQKPPDEKHWFGTDQIGRDTLSRVIYGSRASLTVAFGAVLFGTTVGALWGLACGYFGGRFDMVEPAPDRVPAILPRPDPGDGDRHGAGRRPGHGDRGHRHHAHPLRRPGDPLGRAVAQGDASMSRRRAASAPRTSA